MNQQRVIPGFTQISGGIYPASAVQVPMKLPQLRDSSIKLLQAELSLSSIVVPCDPKFVRATPHMSSSAEYEEAHDLSPEMDRECTFAAKRHEKHLECPRN